MVEQRPFKPKVVGSIPTAPTNFVATKPDLTGVFCTSGSEREFTVNDRWYANVEIQAEADRDAPAPH